MCVYFFYCNVLVVNTNKLCRLVVYLHKVSDPKAYSLKVRLLRLPDRFGRKLLIKLVDGELPGRSISTQGDSPVCVYPKSVSTSSTRPFWS